jgi:hypothetical protein
MLRYLCIACLVFIFCSPAAPPAEDEDLALFVQTFAGCARVYRMYSNDGEMMSDELALIGFPPNWLDLTDSLLASYGGDIGFWSATFAEIDERSRR